jgi:peptidoglycan/xylan/chitin deacetylase (PgdA/CDA1 family)
LQNIRARTRRFTVRPVGILALLAALVLSLSCSDVDKPVTSEPTVAPAVETPQMWEGKSFAFTVTSDDGHADNRAWANVFRDLGLRYTLFITARWVGRPGKLTVNDLRRLQADGFEIGGHSLSHPRLTDCTDSARVYEMKTCRDTLETMIHASDYHCRTFAYPFHAHDERVMTTAARFYTAARDGGLDARGYPDFARGSATWDNTSLFEVPLAVPMADLTNLNKFTEMRTRIGIRNRLSEFRKHRRWVVVNTHHFSDCDSLHMRWILEEIQAAGDAWIAPFGEVAGCFRCKIGLPRYSVAASPGPEE